MLGTNETELSVKYKFSRSNRSVTFNNCKLYSFVGYMNLSKS